MLKETPKKFPPKNKPFLAKTLSGIEMMDWKERIVNGESVGWYGFYNPCCCCSGHCSCIFKLWMPLPETPIED